MSSKSIPIKETLFLAVGEIAVSAVTVAVFLILQKYDLAVLLGAILGSVVMIVNFLFLSISINKAIDKALENAPKTIAKRLEAAESGEEPAVAEATADAEGGTSEDGAEDEPDEAEIFAKEYSLQVQNSARLSYIIRTLSMVAVLVVAFLLPGVFNVISAVVPMLLFRPILMLESYIRNRRAK